MMKDTAQLHLNSFLNVFEDHRKWEKRIVDGSRALHLSRFNVNSCLACKSCARFACAKKTTFSGGGFTEIKMTM